jgi:hypothetical protein
MGCEGQKDERDQKKVRQGSVDVLIGRVKQDDPEVRTDEHRKETTHRTHG